MRKGFITAVLLFAALGVHARVISYAPYSDRVSYPALQNRLNRHIVIIEGDSPAFNGGILISPPFPGSGSAVGQLVIYDTKGLEEPRVVFPSANTLTGIYAAAVREDGAGVPTILIQTNFNFNGTNPQSLAIWLLSIDGGTTWKKIDLPTIPTLQVLNYLTDTGGPFARSRGSNIRVGTIDTPFVVASNDNNATASLFSVSRDGATKKLFTSTGLSYVTLAGANHDGTRFVIRSDPATLRVVDLQGNVATIATVDPSSNYEAWITSNNSVYVDEQAYNHRALWLFAGGVKTWISGPIGTNAINQATFDTGFFAVPTFDHNGAWMIQRGTGKPTTLLLHTAAAGVVTQWTDITAPEVEALHAGASGKTLLIQVHRPRQAADQRLFKDPALAVWHTTDPLPPSYYDELFMAEQDAKGFVHVDVDALESGDMFVFDSGPIQQGGGVIVSPPPPSSGGGSDVVQEWGVVKASLAQRLVIPGVARTPGAYGSYWLTDVTFRNPSDAAVTVAVRYAPTGDVTTADVKLQNVTLKPREIKLVADVLKTLFNAEVGGGALFLTPPVGASIEAAARTYSTSSAGTFGYGMNAIDVFTAASARFPVSFAGAFPGNGFRTNLVLTDVSGRGTDASLVAAGVSGITGASGISFSAVPNGNQQINGIGAWLGLGSSESGGLLLSPTHGETVAAVFAIDNKTNDPTYFPPDLPAPVVRTIPAIGHLDGANNSKFRSDLYLYNPSKQIRNVTLQCTPWDPKDPPMTINLTLLANEARVIRDVLFAAFGKSGIARIRYQSQGDPGVRVTSRTYTVAEDGGTFGFLMPPLNSFQAAGLGDTLEILGAVVDSRFRTNLGIVDLTSFATTTATRFRVDIVGAQGNTLDSFESTVGSASGVQLNDLFGSRNITTTGPVLLRVTPINGMIGTFATLIDNGTNDPMYLPANLAAKN
ncbi:MAG TPA: hypothetical protein VJ032_12480 [Thermoanaerobaculia bacterium]|nr:hypothetical protein [Thermoanaerobaculia bacterium]